MHGTVGVRLYMNRSDKGVRRFTKRFTERFAQVNPSVNKSVQPHVFDFWAYDTAWAVAMAVERAAVAMMPRISGSSSRSSASTDLTKLDVAIDGPRLLKAIHDTRFRGLCGEFLLVDGQLPVSAFEIVNVSWCGCLSTGTTPVSSAARCTDNWASSSASFAARWSHHQKGS
ncbi:hypothetical protein OPV22_025994 [Ensete ventricosum]|uniref:Receptor ligand binding region domain-containing protein n=1 Tax=Ensete ventricosum TaxID=4639 RepID=A0AAV8Q8Y5_ENSVE|nr:hypothetical protein OPV22_025994 [Ensete ventricosum]